MRNVAGVRPLRRSLDDRRPHDRTVGLLAAVQQPQRFGDPPRILVILNGDRETAPKSLLVAPDRCMYLLAIIATCAAGVDRPCGYENELSTPVESAFSTNRICTCPNRIPRHPSLPRWPPAEPWRTPRRNRDGSLKRTSAHRCPWPARLAAAGILEEFGRRNSLATGVPLLRCLTTPVDVAMTAPRTSIIGADQTVHCVSAAAFGRRAFGTARGAGNRVCGAPGVEDPKRALTAFGLMALTTVGCAVANAVPADHNPRRVDPFALSHARGTGSAGRALGGSTADSRHRCRCVGPVSAPDQQTRRGLHDAHNRRAITSSWCLAGSDRPCHTRIRPVATIDRRLTS